MNGLYLLLLTGLQTLPCQLPLTSCAMHSPHSLPADREERERSFASHHKCTWSCRESAHCLTGCIPSKEEPRKKKSLCPCLPDTMYSGGLADMSVLSGKAHEAPTGQAWAHLDKLTSGITNRSLFKTQKSSSVKFSMFTSSLLLGTLFSVHSLPLHPLFDHSQLQNVPASSSSIAYFNLIFCTMSIHRPSLYSTPLPSAVLDEGINREGESKMRRPEVFK